MSGDKAMTVLIMAGGTGGHVIPALSVAKNMLARGFSVRWLGTRRGIESELVPKSGIAIDFITVEGVRGKRLLAWLKLPFQLLRAIAEAIKVIRQLRPNVVLGLGGFASGPGGIAARLLGLPLVIHEQNAIAGTTNRLLGRVAQQRLEAFPHSLARAVMVGNPVRHEIFELPLPENRYESRNDSKNLLILGGSLGALKLNELIPAAVALMNSDERPTIWHQCGKNHIEATQKAYADCRIEARIDPFIDDMARAYGWADLVVCRSGALTVAEITAAGVAALFVPYPFAIDDHQTRNAEWLVKNDAAELRQQNQLTPGSLQQLLSELMSDRNRLLAMASNAKRLAMPDAADKVVEACVQAAS